MGQVGTVVWETAKASRFRPDGIVGTPFHSRTARNSATPWYFNWDLHHVVDVYDDFHTELGAIRESVAMGDMSPLCKCRIEGPDAARLVDHLVPRSTENLRVGSIQYTPWCNDDGKVVSDGLIFRLDEESYRFTGDPTTEWFLSKAEGFDVEIRDETDDYGILMVQGPRSRDVVNAATGTDWADLDFSRAAWTSVGGIDIQLARQGFTGELGYELFIPANDAAHVWDVMVEAGQPFGIQLCGEWAIDVARVEAGLLIPGPDYANAGPDRTGSHTPSASDPTCESSPYEIGMGSFVDLSKESFVGKEALVAEHQNGGPSRTLSGLDIDWRWIVNAYLEADTAPNVSPRGDWVTKSVKSGDREVGRASSVTWSPTVSRLIAFGHLETACSDPGTEVTVDWEIAGTNKTVQAPATVTVLPFLGLRRA